jgi:hypothetical protein
MESLLTAAPEALSAAQLDDLRDQLTGIRNHSHLNLVVPRYLLLDTLQRQYAPNGRFASDGLFLKSIHGDGFFFKVLVLPWLDMLFPNARQVRQRVEKLMDDSLAYNQLPLWKQLHTMTPMEKYDAVEGDRWGVTGFVTFEMFLVSDWGRWPLSQLRAKFQAMDVAVAMEQFRRAKGRFPHTLDELTPDYLASQPVDASTGLPLLYKLVDGKPLLYGRGRDGDDDGGVNDDDHGRDKKSIHSQGDWILYPQVEADK